MTLVADPLPSPPGEIEVAGAATSDRVGRLVAPVIVNGQGPYRFIIDTGANRSALSSELAAQLGLVTNATGQVHTIDEVATAPLVNVNSIEYAGVTFGGVQAPLIHGPVLAGEDGLLGVDGMEGRRLILDFQHGCIEIAPSRRARPLAGWTRVRGQLRFGHLVLIQGTVRERRINVLIDTGSGSSLANNALREALRGVAVSDESNHADLLRAFTAGTPVILDSSLILPQLRLGDVTAETVTAYIGDLHIFDLWGLRDEPTLLIGMDVLSKARAIAIDYATGDVYFRLEEERRTGSLLRGVNNGPIISFRGRD